MNTCDIPERTAYRYLNTISEANIPVYYDSDQHAYRINRKRSMLVNSVDLGDALVIALALRLLASRVNEAYRDEIEQLVAQVLVRQPCPLEDVMDTFESSLRAMDDEADCSELISTMLLHAAILCEKRVKLTTSSNGQSGAAFDEVEVTRPRLKFQRKWHVVDGENAEAPVTSLTQVQKVSIN